MGGNRLLMVEDDRVIASMYEIALRAAGWDVLVAADGLTGVEAAIADPPAVVLLDIMLPRLNGIEVLERLRAHPATCHVTVVVLSNSAGLPSSLEAAAALSAVDWMVKSRTTPRELAARLAAFRG